MKQLVQLMRPIFRIGLRDAAAIMRSSTWLGLFLAPLLLALLLLGLILAVVVLVVALKVLLPEGEDTALGHNRVAVVLRLPAEPERRAEVRAQVDAEILPALAADQTDLPQEAQLFKRGISFIRALRQAQSNGSATGVDSAPPVSNLPPESAQNESDAQARNTTQFELFPDGDWEKVSAQVPDRFDLALHITPEAEGTLNYELRADAGLLASRVMERRIRDRLIALERRSEASTDPRQVQVRVLDQVSSVPDPWLFSALAALAALGLVFMYHSVAAQAVGSVLAGERDQRTLDVLLSLPITRRQILYGKMMGLLVITATPACFWSLLLWIPAIVWLGLAIPWGLPALMLSLQAFLMATGVAVSASSADLPTARNRLGMVNLALLAAGGLGLGLPSLLAGESTRTAHWLLKTVCAGGPEGALVMLSAAAGLGVATLLILEVGLAGFKRLT